MISGQKASHEAVTWMQPQFNETGQFSSSVMATQFDAHDPIGEFDVQLDFKNITPERIEQYTQTIILQTKAVYDRIAELNPETDDLSFANVLQPIINIEAELANMTGLVSIMQHFSADKEIRDASVEADKKISDFRIECAMRHDVFKVFDNYYQNQHPKEKDQLSKEENRLVDDTMKAYRRSGLNLDSETRDKVLKLKQAISKNEITFNRNLDEENTSFIFKKEQLAGVPEDFFTEKRHVKDNLYKVTLDYPDYFPIMDYCKNRQVRRKMYEAFQSRCKDKNSPLFEENVRMRHQLANLLGYASHADVKIEPKMAKTAANVQQFLAEMNERFTPLLKKDMQRFATLAQAETGRKKFNIKPWDLRYYARINEEELGEIDMQEVKSYFPLDIVIKGMFEIYEQLLGLKFIEVETDNKWHEEAKAYAVYNQGPHQETGDKVGTFYIDLHPREGKYGHAAMFDIVNGCDLSKVTGKKGRRKPVAGMACNFPADSCLPFSDVVTFFHEFGHVMHGICGKTQLADYHGTNCQEDFVEAPSQMLENWCYTSEALKKLSAHKDTKEPIPNHLIEKLIALKKINQGYLNKRQLTFGMFDMAMHTPEVASKRCIDSRAEFDKVQRSVFGISNPSSTNFAATFGHLMGGYEAGYYGYMMSLTYATDMFYTCFKDNPLDPKMGKRYRECILAPGGSEDAIDLLKNFLGREPKVDAFLEDTGLTTSDEKAKTPREKLKH